MNENNVVIELPGSQDITISPQNVKVDLPKYWNRDYINARLAGIDNSRHRMLFLFLWMTGARITEALNVKKQDIDFAGLTINIRWLKSRKYNHRILPIHPHLGDILRVYTASMKAEDRLYPITRHRAWLLCRRYFNGSPHQFRHSFAVNWLRCGGDVVVLHRILGHSQVQTTMEYLKIVPVDQGKELQKVQF